MPRLVRIEIRNFRSIQQLDIDVDRNSNLVCFIGRGDSGKTIILEAISAVLSPTWNLTFYDTDFYKCDHNNNNEILATVVEVPEKLLSQDKFGSLFSTFSNTFYDRYALIKGKIRILIKFLVQKLFI